MSRPGHKNHNGLFVAPSRTMFVSTYIIFGRSKKPPGNNREKSFIGIKTSPIYPALNVLH